MGEFENGPGRFKKDNPKKKKDNPESRNGLPILNLIISNTVKMSYCFQTFCKYLNIDKKTCRW